MNHSHNYDGVGLQHKEKSWFLTNNSKGLI